MSVTTSDAVAGSGAVRVRALVAFADGLRRGTILDHDQTERLVRDIAAVGRIAKEQFRRYEMAAATNYGRRQEAVLDQAKAQYEYKRLQAEYTEMQTELAVAREHWGRHHERLQEARWEFDQARADAAKRSETSRHAQDFLWVRGMGYDNPFGDPDSSVQGRVERAEEQLREISEGAERASARVEEARARVDVLQRQIDELVRGPRHRDDAAGRAAAAVRRASEAGVVAVTAEHFCAELAMVVGCGGEVDEFVTRLNCLVEAVADEGPGPMTGRALLERLAVLADGDVE